MVNDRMGLARRVRIAFGQSVNMNTIQIRLVAGIAICLLALSAEAQYSGGTGEPNDPYQIATAEDLIALGQTPEDYDKHFVLCADIDLDKKLPGRRVFDRAVIAPDVNEDEDSFQGTAFIGVFDGNGHTISNLTIEGGGYLGLIGQARSGMRISNLGLEAVVVNGIGVHIGGVVGQNYGSVLNCYSTGTVSGRYDAGGLVGSNHGSVTLSYSTGVINGDEDIGGLVGDNGHGGSITTSYSTGSVSGGRYVGGLVGDNTAGSITKSYSTATVNGSSRVGGLVGFNYGHPLGTGSSITTSYSTASVSGSFDVGGLVGYNGGMITTSYSTGVVNGDEDIGGLVGANRHGGSITTCYGTGSVTGHYRVGGLVGENVRGSITSCYSTGTVSGSDDVRGLVGENDRGSITKSFWDVETSDQTTSAGGTGLTTPEMQDINTYLGEGWDFVDEVLNGTCDYWQISPSDYPRLYYHASNSPVMPGGLGTAEQPYLIRDARDLGTVWFKPIAHYRLETPVDLSGITWSMAVVPWFKGTFDGNGHVISNLHTQGGACLGLFGQAGREAKIVNLGLEAVDINGNGDTIGALVGENGGRITSCYSVGTVSGGDVAGLVGVNSGGSITTSYSMGAVTGEAAAGLVLMPRGGRITMCYSTSAVTGRNGIESGPLYGIKWGGTFTSCFWDMETSGCPWGGGVGRTGLTTAEMQSASTFLEAGWDFIGETDNGTDDIWWIPAGQGYPRLWWEDLYVDDDAPGDPGPGDPHISDPLEDGHLIHPFDSIQEAIDSARDGCTVRVRGGVYGEPIDFRGKAITVQSGPDVAVIETPDDYAVSFYSGEGPDSVLRNFIIRNSQAGVFVPGSSPTIHNLTVVDNEYGITAYTWAQPDIRNCVFWNNRERDLFQCEARFSCIEDGDPGEGNLCVDPLFVDPDNGDYHLLSAGWYWSSHTNSWTYGTMTSPCIDAGDPDSPLCNELLSVPRDPDNEWGENLRINIGAYGGTARASMMPLGWMP